MPPMPGRSSGSTVETVAHRGANRLRTENTLAAFAVALDQGADAIELDVHATADGVVIVHHDPDIVDMAAASRRRRRLADMTWDLVQRVKLSGGESVPRLADVLTLAAGRARVYVEIKGRNIEQAVVQTIRASGAECAVHSFDHGAIGRVRELASELPRGLLLDEGDPQARDVARLIDRYGARDLWPHRSLVNEALVSAAHRAGARVVVWTVNDVAQARALVALDVDALCTDDVPLIERVRAESNDG